MLWAASSIRAAELLAVSVAQDGARTALTLEFKGRPQSKLMSLHKPARAVIDLRGSQRGKNLDLPSASGSVTDIRTGPLAGTAGLRLVVQLDGPIRALRQRPLSPANGRQRLLIEWSAANPAATKTASTRTLAGPATTQPVVAATPNNVTSPVSVSSAPPVRPQHAPGDNGRDIVVAIDAGHGGQDPGASGRRGTFEKDVVLAIARRLAAKINAEPGMRAVLTRDGDYFIALRERSARARRAKADLFVSVHADAVRDREVSGASVYVLSEKGATDEQARWLADQENAADLKGGIPLDDKNEMLASVLLDLSLSASIAESMRAAEHVLQTLGKIADVRKPRVQQAGFVVLKSPDIPSMLVETAYISNPSDESDLLSDAHRERIAAAICMGVRQYFVDHPPDGTRFALDRRHGSATASTR